MNVINGGRGALRTLALTAGHKRDRFCIGAGRARNGGRRNAYGEKDCVADDLGQKGIQRRPCSAVIPSIDSIEGSRLRLRADATDLRIVSMTPLDARRLPTFN